MSMETTTLGAGCFWCIEAVYQDLQGVESAVSGYMGGANDNPTYRQICGGNTGHAEVLQIQFDPAIISFADLLYIFWRTHDPTTLNRQGADQGARYRSVVLYTSDAQRDQTAAYIKELDASGDLPGPVVTEIAPFEKFFEAEAEHRQFYLNNQGSMYCQIVISPKVAKVRQKFAKSLR